MSVSPLLKHALADLDKLAAQRASLDTSCRVVQEVLTALFVQSIAEQPLVVGVDIAREKLAAGVPLLRGENITLEGVAWRRRWLSVCAAVARQNTNAAAVASAFADLNAAALLAEVLAGRPQAVHARADSLGLDAALTATVLRLTALPVLAAFALAVEPLRRGSAWERGYCPMCGAWPLLGELRGLEQTRWLRCGWCAAEWQFARLCCPFCDNRDHRRLGFYHVEDEDNRCRAMTCEECRGYVKTVFTLDALSPPALLIADLATLHLDLAVADRGYLIP